MAVFALMAVSGTAFAPVIFSWVEANPRLEWRWIQWIQIILVGVYLPSIPLFMPETRAAVLLKKQARKMRRRKDKVVDEVQKEQGGGVEEKGKWDDGMKYLARGEVGKPKFGELMRVSLIRPIRESSTTSSPSFHAVRVTDARVARRPLGDGTDRHLLHPLDLGRLGRHVRARPVHTLRVPERVRVRDGEGRVGLPGFDVSFSRVRLVRDLVADKTAVCEQYRRTFGLRA